MTLLRLTHPDLDFWVDVRVHQFDGRWLAVADLADQRELGTGGDARQALDGALATLGTVRGDLVARALGMLEA